MCSTTPYPFAGAAKKEEKVTKEEEEDVSFSVWSFQEVQILGLCWYKADKRLETGTEEVK